ncbi:MAG TPA: response regulator [Terriglobia bacterium]|nr:response regulator [Terriglobia bacterium]
MQQRILAVDDDNDARLAVQTILERERMHVTPATSAEDGLCALSSAHFDLVITDFRMKLKTGLDLVRETRDHGVGVPFILLTGDNDAAIRIFAAELGVMAVLKKPVRKRLLLDHVDLALSIYRPQGHGSLAESHVRCSATCTFSLAGFCSIPTRDRPD